MLTWLADTLRGAGCSVVELDGWRTRTRSGSISPRGVVWHHTATGPGVSDKAVDKLLRDGRPDLPGPLCQLGLRRDGTFVVVAAGRCNHNGFGTWGNDSIGIEAYNDGIGEPWSAAQLEAYVKGTAAICARNGWGIDRVLGHKETDPNRKVDPRGIDMTWARFCVAVTITGPPPITEEDDPDMAQIVKHPNGTMAVMGPGPAVMVLTSMEQVRALWGSRSAVEGFIEVTEYIWDLRVGLAKRAGLYVG